MPRQSTNTELKMFMPTTSSRSFAGLISIPPSRAPRQPSGLIPSRSKTAFVLLAIPTMLIFRFLSFIRRSRCDAICSSSFPPTVPTPQTNRFSSWYSERKKLSWITFRALRRFPRFTMNDMLLSEEPWAQAITLMPLRPSVPNSFPAIPAWYFMFSPTTATAASSFSMCMGAIAPLSSS